MGYEVGVREAGAQPILSVRAVVPEVDLVGFFDEACDEMRAYAAEQSVRAVGPAMSLWHSAPGEIPGGFDIETCLPVADRLPSAGRMRYGELPAGLQAFTVHEGAYDNMSRAFDAVWQWIGEHGYAMDGAPRDVVLVGPNDTSDVTAYRTEIVYPVTGSTRLTRQPG